MFDDSGLPMSTHTPAAEDPCCSTHPPGSVDSGCFSSTFRLLRPYVIELQAFYGLEQQAPAPLSTDANGASMFMMPDFDEEKGGLNMHRFLYPTIRQMQSADGPVLAQWCTCSPEQHVRKDVLQHMPSDGQCSAEELVGIACLHTAALKVTCFSACMHA